MAKILVTWELGGHAGHIHPLSSIAGELKKRGHRVMLAVKNLATAEQYLPALEIDFVQAPLLQRRTNSALPPAINYAELLTRVGYLDVDQVAGQIRAWITLINLLQPDMVLANHSPGALLATRLLKIKTAPMGTGFLVPPVLPLMPSLQPFGSFPQERFVQSENNVLDSINRALNRCGGQSLSCLSEMFDACCQYLLTLPEVDHYGRRETARYWGLIQSSQVAAAPVWPKIPGPKVFVYMPFDVKPYRSLLASLKQLGWPTLVVSRNITAQQAEPLQAANLLITPEAVNLQSVAQAADIIVTNSNHGTVVELLQQGCRQLLVPLQVEQAMLTNRLASQGLVVAASPSLPDYRELIRNVVNDRDLGARVKAFSQIYGQMDSRQQLAGLVDDIERQAGSQ